MNYRRLSFLSLTLGSFLAVQAAEFPLVIPKNQEEILASEKPYYVIEDVLPPPSGDRLEIGCLTALPGDRMAVGTRRGVILIAHNVSSPDISKITWTVYARGLYEPLGMQWRDNALYVIQKPEFTKLQDLDGDGVADRYETVTDRWGFSGNYHEFAFCSPIDKDGNTWIALCLTNSSRSEERWRGWAMRLFPDGHLEPSASGIRSPGGMGTDSNGDVYYDDNQGFWHGSSCLKLLTPKSFQGTYTGNIWYKDAPDMGPEPMAIQGESSRIEAERKRVPQLVPPAVIIPHGIVGNSPTAIVCDTTGSLGPFKNQLFISEQTASQIQRVYIEKINGVAQGMVAHFRSGFSAGPIGMTILPNGIAYLGGSTRGWKAPFGGDKEYALQRMRYTGKIPFEVERMNISPDGFIVTFTQPVGSSAESLNSYSMSAWTYLYRPDYGSPQVDTITPKITAAKLSSDKLSVRLTVEGWRQGHVHELNLPGVKSATNAPLLHNVVWYTINEIPNATK